jgi:hypothetical protein
MKELIKYLVIRITTRHAKTAVDIYQVLYPIKEKEIVYVDRIVTTSTCDNISVSTVSNDKSKKNEVISSLEYLKINLLKQNRIRILSTR